MKKLQWLWHEPTNYMALVDTTSTLPLVNICDDEYMFDNPFHSYSLYILQSMGWTIIGEL